jgi:hypothetical protein
MKMFGIESTPVAPYQPLAAVYQSNALKLGMNQPAVREPESLN